MASRSLSDSGLLIFTCALFGALTLPALFMDGMFTDGTFYASIARNFSDGHGSFWNMYFSETYFPSMHEQPPLMFALQAGFFRIFGVGIYTERIYCAVTAFVSAVLVIRSWNLITRSKSSQVPAVASTAWLPLFLWIIMPVTFYAFINNLEECTMVIFVLLSFNCIVRAIFATQEKHIFWIIAGVWTLAAGLTKGVQGMFLLSAPLWCTLILKNGGLADFFKRSLLISLVPALFVIIAWCTPEIRHSFGEYFGSRYTKTFSGITAHGDTRFHLLFELLIDTLPTLACMLVFIIAGRKIPRFFEQVKSERKIYFILACAFSGILPLLVTREQRGFYLVTALPLVAIACGMIVRPSVQRFSDYVAGKKRFARGFAIAASASVIAVLLVTFCKAGEPKRDAEKIAGLHEIAGITGDNVTFNASSFLNNDWGFLSYGQRYHHFSVTDNPAVPTQWYILEEGAAAPSGYSAVSIRSTFFDLYRKTDE